MKIKYLVRGSFLLYLLGISNTLWAVTLPSQSYTVYSPLYEMNHDNVKMDQGTLFKGINHVLQASNDEWGTDCLGQYDKGESCKDCCRQKLAAFPLDQQLEHTELFTACITMCNTGLPLGGAPLDIPLWFIMPLCALYGVIQRIRSKTIEKQ